MRRHAASLLAIAMGVAVLSVVMGRVADSRRASRERNASSALKTLASAEAHFRGNDSDGNRIQDFWTGDVASLYYLEVPQPLRLILKDIADADARPLRKGAPAPEPKDGYYFVAMEMDDSSGTPRPYAEDTGGQPNRGAFFNHSRFGFCAYPAKYPGSGRWTFLINEGNTVVKVDSGGKPVLRWPGDPYCPKCYGRDTTPGHPCWPGKLD